MISQSPMTFVMALAVMLGFVWLLARWVYGTRISILEDRLRLRDDQLRQFSQSATSTGSARRLTEGQKQRIAATAYPPAGADYKIEICHDGMSVDSSNFAADLRRAFRAIQGWEVDDGLFIGDEGSKPPTGILLLVDSLESPSAAERLVIDALNSAGLSFNQRQPGCGSNKVYLQISEPNV